MIRKILNPVSSAQEYIFEPGREILLEGISGISSSKASLLLIENSQQKITLKISLSRIIPDFLFFFVLYVYWFLRFFDYWEILSKTHLIEFPTQGFPKCYFVDILIHSPTRSQIYRILSFSSEINKKEKLNIFSTNIFFEFCWIRILSTKIFSDF